MKIEDLISRRHKTLSRAIIAALKVKGEVDLQELYRTVQIIGPPIGKREELFIKRFLKKMAWYGLVELNNNHIKVKAEFYELK